MQQEQQHCLLSGHEKCGGCVYNSILIKEYQKKLSIWQEKLEKVG